MKKTGLLLIAIFSLVFMGFDESEMENEAPTEVESFTEENYRDFILDIVNDSNAAAFNFTKSDQNVTIGRVFPENRLVIDRNLNITVEPPVEWVAPVYQNGEVKNAISIWEPSKDKYEIAGIGYAHGLAYGIAHLEDDEYYLYSRPFKFDFAYSPSKNRVRPLGDGSIRHFEQNSLDLNGITKKEFVFFVKQHLKNKYPDQFNEKTDESRFPYIYGGIAVLVLLGVFYLLKRQKRSLTGSKNSL